MKRVLWLAEAREDIAQIVAYFAERDARVAALIVGRIERAAVELGRRDTGRPGRMPKLREKSVARTAYIIAYRVRRRDVLILRIIHGARNWTAEHWPERDE